ncbi:MAG TPA: hypothetical protein VMF60_10695 [Acidimicrobiales bacterium]|nr:hypothetical protein [Acidimicrobiales bacterium]
MTEDRSASPRSTGSAARPERERSAPDPDEVVDEEGEESFPASDSPSWWSGPPLSR